MGQFKGSILAIIGQLITPSPAASIDGMPPAIMALQLAMPAEAMAKLAHEWEKGTDENLMNQFGDLLYMNGGNDRWSVEG